MFFTNNWQLPLLNQWKEKRKYVARPGIEPRISDLRVKCPTNCATWPGLCFRSYLIRFCIVFLDLSVSTLKIIIVCMYVWTHTSMPVSLGILIRKKMNKYCVEPDLTAFKVWYRNALWAKFCSSSGGLMFSAYNNFCFKVNAYTHRFLQGENCLLSWTM